MAEMKVLSLGWGVQSFALAAMIALGDLEQVDFAIHADTTHERRGTYKFRDRWEPWLRERGLEVVTVRPGQRVRPVGSTNTDLPVFAAGDNGHGRGMLSRQCTGFWKIAPMRREIRRQMRTRGIKLLPDVVQSWIGISLDEYKRMRVSNVDYAQNRYPLIEQKMSRWDCKKYLQLKGLEVPPRSSCVFCPYHDNGTWREIKTSPDDWNHAVMVDIGVRHVRPPGELFLHRDLVPLEHVDLRSPEDKGQLSLWENECEGVCGT